MAILSLLLMKRESFSLSPRCHNPSHLPECPALQGASPGFMTLPCRRFLTGLPLPEFPSPTPIPGSQSGAAHLSGLRSRSLLLRPKTPWATELTAFPLTPEYPVGLEAKIEAIATPHKKGGGWGVWEGKLCALQHEITSRKMVWREKREGRVRERGWVGKAG